jgi:hypothetical protein
MSLLKELILAKQIGMEGGGSGGDGMERFPVAFTYVDGQGFVANQTLAQITAAKNAGKYVEGVYAGQYCPLVALTSEAAAFQMLVRMPDGVQLNQLAVVTSGGCVADAASMKLKEVVETISETTATIDAENNHIYKCGTMSALTVNSCPQTGEWGLIFTSGSPATVLTLPSSVRMPDDFTVGQNMDYEIWVLDGRGVDGCWPTE